MKRNLNIANSRKPTRLPEQRWEAVRDAFVMGEGSLGVLAERFAVSIGTLEARCRRQHWVRLRQQRKENHLREVVGEIPPSAGPVPFAGSAWWADRDKEHLLRILELTAKLRQAVELKIPDASATELEKLASSISAIASTEREVLELTPRPARQAAPSLRPRVSERRAAATIVG